LIDEQGLYDASNILGLPISKIFRMTGRPIKDNDECYSIIGELLRNKELDKVFHIDDYKIIIDDDYYEGTVMWEIQNKTHYYDEDDLVSEITGLYATPFWDGTAIIPIEATFYYAGGEQEIYGELIRDEIDFEQIYIDIEDKFDNIDKLIEWYYKFYIPKVFNMYRNKILPELREQISKSQ